MWRLQYWFLVIYLPFSIILLISTSSLNTFCTLSLSSLTHTLSSDLYSSTTFSSIYSCSWSAQETWLQSSQSTYTFSPSTISIHFYSANSAYSGYWHLNWQYPNRSSGSYSSSVIIQVLVYPSLSVLRQYYTQQVLSSYSTISLSLM